MSKNNDQLEASKLNNNPDEDVTLSNRNWTLFLVFSCLTAAVASFQYGFNISSLNTVTPIIMSFMRNETFLFKEYHDGVKKFAENEIYLNGNETKYKNALLDMESKKSEYAYCKIWGDEACINRIEKERDERVRDIREKFNRTIDEHLEFINQTLVSKRNLLETYRVKLTDGEKKVNRFTDILWTITNTMFVIGGATGAFTSKYLMDFLGRRLGLVFHSIFSIIGAILVIIAPFINSPICIIVSRFLFGIQGGMACTLAPTYISEIAPKNLRGQAGLIQQLGIVLGILFGQLLGLRQALGTINLWNYMLGFPIIPSIFCSLAFFFIFPETPKALLIKSKDITAARKALQRLRNDKNVQSDIQEIYEESDNKGGNSEELITLKELFTLSELRWPLITSLVLQVAQQLSGVNAVFFYSSSIFAKAGITDSYIQYAILSTGLINLVATLVCIPMIDKLGRRPLLIFPMLTMIIDFILLTVFLALQGSNPVYSYLCIVCVMVFVICFAVGLGPIPFIYVGECFRQNARSSATSICIATNWLSTLLITLFFPLLHQVLDQYVFLVFTVIIAVVVAIIIKKVPETKGKSIEEIINSF